MIKNKILLKSLTLTFFLVSLCGCSTIFGEGENRPIEPLTREETRGKGQNEPILEENTEKDLEEAGASLSYPLTLRDYKGKETILEKKPERIVSLSPVANEILDSLGAIENLFGARGLDDYEGPLDLSSNNPSLYEDISDAQVDFVIYDKDLPDYLVKLWEEKGIKTYLVGANSFEAILENIKNLGNVVEKVDRADKIVGMYENRLKEISQGPKGNPQVRVFYEVSKDPLKTLGQKTVLDQALQLLGAENIAKDLYGLEKIDPKKIQSKEIEAYILLYQEKNIKEREARLLDLEEEKKDNIKKIYLLQVEDWESGSIYYFDTLEEIATIIEDSGQKED